MVLATKDVWVAGEALIDLVPSGEARVPKVGGGAANTAKALVKLGIPTAFIGGISSDSYGSSIREELREVDLTLTHHSDFPTALAIVTLDVDGSASYEFKLKNTSTFDFRSEWLPLAKPEVLHVGTLATIIEPGASQLFTWAKNLNTHIIFDPNVRPTVIDDRDKYRQIVEKWVGISEIVKLSREDLDWLGYFNVTKFFELGAKLVVVTSGAEGITGYSQKGVISVPGVRVEVVDTVGAGDTVGAVLVEGLLKYGMDGLVGESLFSVLRRAAIAAAITCTRAGANPPSASEIDSK